MSIELLDKTRKINRLLLGSPTSVIPMEDISETAGEVLASNVVILDERGRILGEYIHKDIEMIGDLHVLKEAVDKNLNERLLSVLSTKENVNLETLGIVHETAHRYKSLMAPIEIAGRRMGTLFVYKNADAPEYSIDDIIFGEYIANITGLVLAQETVLEDDQKERRRQVVNAALHTLSLSETEALLAVFQKLEQDSQGEAEMEGLLVVGKIADQVGITRSVLVNALRKFESAGILETKSSGMKGTYVKVLIPEAYDFLKRFL